MIMVESIGNMLYMLPNKPQAEVEIVIGALAEYISDKYGFLVEGVRHNRLHIHINPKLQISIWPSHVESSNSSIVISAFDKSSNRWFSRYKGASSLNIRLYDPNLISAIDQFFVDHLPSDGISNLSKLDYPYGK